MSISTLSSLPSQHVEKWLCVSHHLDEGDHYNVIAPFIQLVLQHGELSMAKNSTESRPHAQSCTQRFVTTEISKMCQEDSTEESYTESACGPAFRRAFCQSVCASTSGCIQR